jgi:hypothetical protein
VYFLQYHRSRQKEQQEPFTLNRAKESDEFECDFVRGITPIEGSIVDMSFSSGMQKDASISTGTYDAYQQLDYIFYELHAKNVQLALATEKSSRHFWSKAIANHF